MHFPTSRIPMSEDEIIPNEEPEIDTSAEAAPAPAEADAEADAEPEGPEEPSAASLFIAAQGLKTMSLQALKDKTPADLQAFAESLEIENANTMRKQDMLYAILKVLADESVEISGSGTLEVLPDGF